MKKILIITAFALINLTTLSANAATTVTAYIAAKCTTTTNTSAKAICNDYTQSCSSTGMDVTTSGTYKDYDDCVLVHSYGDSTENGTYSRYVICMPSNTNGTNACKRLKELHTNTSFKGMGSGIGPSGTTFGAAGLNKTITLYMEQLNCISGCSGYTDSTPSTGVLFREPNVCTTDGTCTTHTNVYGKYLTCTIGYYSSAGLAKKLAVLVPQIYPLYPVQPVQRAHTVHQQA